MEQIYKIRVPDELKAAILSGDGYKNVKLNNVTLDNLKKIYQSRLDECEDNLEHYYEHGSISIDVDRMLHFKTHGIELIAPKQLNIDRDSLIDTLLAILAVYDRKGCRDLIDAIDRKISDNIRRLSVDGVSSLAESILEDVRHATRVLDGVQLNEDGDVKTEVQP